MNVEFWIFENVLTTQKTGVIKFWNYLLTFHHFRSTLWSWLHKISTKTRNLSPWLENNHTLKCCFWQFSDITKYIRVYGKMPGQYYNVLLFSNPGDKVLILVTSRGRIGPIVFKFLKTLSPLLKKSDTLKCWFNIFPSTLIQTVM